MSQVFDVLNHKKYRKTAQTGIVIYTIMGGV